MYFIVLLVILMLEVRRCEGKFGGSACTGCTTTCILLPPEGVSFPCYQGTPEDAAFCFKSDPLLKDGTTWQCGTCAGVGYPTYIHNDPIYKNMELYEKSG